MLHLLFKKTSFLFQNDLSHCSASSIVFFSASAVTGVMRYLVLKSNGLHRPKIRLKKFGFSSKSVPANIAKKLPAQRCSQPLFNFAHKWPTSAFTGESGYTPTGSHTAAYTPKQGAFRTGVVSLLSERSARSPASPGRVSERQVLPLLGLGRRRS